MHFRFDAIILQEGSKKHLCIHVLLKVESLMQVGSRSGPFAEEISDLKNIVREVSGLL